MGFHLVPYLGFEVFMEVVLVDVMRYPNAGYAGRCLSIRFYVEYSTCSGHVASRSSSI